MKSQEAIAESSLPKSENNSHTLDHNPATAQRQREYAKARKARKTKGFANEPLQGKRVRFPPEVKKALIAQVGRKRFDSSMRFIVNRREAFLNTDPAIRAAATIEGGKLSIDTSKLNAEQTQAVLAFAWSSRREGN